MPTVRDLLISIRVKDQTAPIDAADKKLTKTKDSAAGLGRELKQLAGAFVGMAAAQKALQQVEKSVDAAAKFGAGIGQIASLIPGQQDRVKQLRGDILNLAQDTGKSLEDLSLGMYQVISSFGDSADSVKQLEIAAKAAVAGNATTAESLNLISAVTNSYGDVNAAASEKVADLAQNTVALGRTTLPELSHAMGIVAGRAASLKMTQEELFAVFAANSVVMNGADRVATGLQAAFVEMTRAGSPSSLALKKLGFAGADSAIEMLGLQGALKAVMGTTNGSAAAFSKMFPPAEAQGIILHVLKDRTVATTDALKSNAKAAKTMRTAYAETTTGSGELQHQLDKERAALEKMEVALGEKMAPTMLKFNVLSLETKKALFEAFEAQMPSVERFVQILGGGDGVGGQMDGIKSSAEGMAEAARLGVGGMVLAFLTLKAVTQEVLGDMMSLSRLAHGDYAGAKAIQAQTTLDVGATTTQMVETVDELMRSPEQSKQHNERRRRLARENGTGFGGQFLDTGLEDVAGQMRWAVGGREFGSKTYTKGAGTPQQAGTGVGSVEIKELTIQITPDKTVDQAKAIVREGVGKGVSEGVRDAQRLLPSAPSGVRRGSI